MITTISSSQDPRLDPLRLGERQLTTIAQRRSTLAAGRFIAEGDLVVARALDAGYKPEVVLCDGEQANRFATDITALGGQCLTADIDIRREATGLGVPLSALGVFFRPTPLTQLEVLEHATRVIVAEAIDNPSNIGAIVRCATGLGWNGLICDTTSADPLSRRALRVSMGAAFNLRFARSNDISETLKTLHGRGYTVLALTPNSSATELTKVSLQQNTPRALVFGSERAGLSDEALACANYQVRIEMNPAIDSLNVAAAAAIACYALR
jgi:tRNA G18 (ribose-2'-O)-methylase SpoU